MGVDGALWEGLPRPLLPEPHPAFWGPSSLVNSLVGAGGAPFLQAVYSSQLQSKTSICFYKALIPPALKNLAGYLCRSGSFPEIRFLSSLLGPVPVLLPDLDGSRLTLLLSGAESPCNRQVSKGSSWLKLISILSSCRAVLKQCRSQQREPGSSDSSVLGLNQHVLV